MPPPRRPPWLMDDIDEDVVEEDADFDEEFPRYADEGFASPASKQFPPAPIAGEDSTTAASDDALRVMIEEEVRRQLGNGSAPAPDVAFPVEEAAATPDGGDTALEDIFADDAADVVDTPYGPIPRRYLKPTPRWLGPEAVERNTAVANTPRRGIVGPYEMHGAFDQQNPFISRQFGQRHGPPAPEEYPPRNPFAPKRPARGGWGRAEARPDR